MPPPPIHVFLTTIASQPALRQRQEFLLRTLEVKKIPFTPYDLASDEEAKKVWRRTAPADKQQLPGFLIGGRFVGTFQDFEEAVEFSELETFLKRNEEHDPEQDLFARPMPAAQAVGVPGANTQHQMTPSHLKTRIYNPDASPLRGRTASGRDAIPVNKRSDQFDVSTELMGYGLQGVMASEDELRQLVEDLGLDGDEAGDLLKGLGAGGGGKDDGVQEKAKESPVKREEMEVPVRREGSESPVKRERTDTRRLTRPNIELSAKKKEIPVKKEEKDGETKEQDAKEKGNEDVTEKSKPAIPEVRVEAEEEVQSKAKDPEATPPSNEEEAPVKSKSESEPETKIPSEGKEEENKLVTA